VWPVTVGGEAERAAAFRSHLETYYWHMQRVGVALYTASALGLGLPATFYHGCVACVVQLQRL
jgi:isopenicillin N synthase-like dioxygenase